MWFLQAAEIAEMLSIKGGDTCYILKQRIVSDLDDIKDLLDSVLFIEKSSQKGS